MAVTALVLQLVLVVNGAATLLPEQQPGLVTRLVRFVSYFTILSNVLVAGTTAWLLRRDPGGRWWRVLRLDAVVGIAVTGVVHWFLLRPLLDLHGASYVADRMLHLAVPLLAVLGWLFFGPRGRVDRRDVALSLIYPVAWLLWTLLHGAVSRWYPYPFVDVDRIGYLRVALNGLGVAALIVMLSLLALVADRRLPGTDREPRRRDG